MSRLSAGKVAFFHPTRPREVVLLQNAVCKLETSISLVLFRASAASPVPSPYGGGEGIRTPDPLLAKQVLSRLSYTPICGLSFYHALLLIFDSTFSNRLIHSTS